MHDLELEVLYAEDCKEYYPNITTTETYESSTGDSNYVDDIVFCAGVLRTGNGPCDVGSNKQHTSISVIQPEMDGFCWFEERISR